MNRRTWIAGGTFASFGDERIFYRVDGAGPTILFSHGFPTSSHDWAPVIATLSASFRCVSFDLLGFGASSKPRRAYSYPLQHEVVAAVARAAGITRAVFVAHDYSVTLGQDFLAGTPAPPFALDGVIFLNGGLDPAQHRARLIQRVLASRIGAVIGLPFINRRTVLRVFRSLLVKTDVISDDDVWEAITANDGRAVQPRLLHYIAERRGRRDALLASLRSAGKKKGFVWGADDPVSGQHVLDAIRPLLGDAPVSSLRGVGHYPQLEAPAEVAAFIAEHAGAWAQSSSATS